jgi:peptidyl-prolyl cis-trans isomerase D
MISAMRRYRKVLQVGLLVVVAAFVASLFIFGSRGVGGGPTPDTVATVNGESISIERFQHRYQAYVEAYRQVYRDRFSSELAEQLGLPQQVVNDLVQEELIVQRARREGLEVSDEEINEQIHAVRGFQENGRFALRLYQAFLRGRGTTAAAFEAEARQELTRLKAESTVRSGVKATPAEVEEAYAFRHDQARAAWALVELGPVLSATTVTDAELQAYLTAHAAEFRQPERRRIQYVTLAQKDFVKPVAEADVQKYYTEHAKEFEAPRQARVSHVLARVPETGGSEAEDKARAKAADVIRRAKAGEDFATLAKALSEDPGSAPKGGDLGFVKQGEMVPEFERAVFALKKGEVSPQPARTPFGYHAIKVFDVKPGGLTPLKAVAAQIREKLQAEAAERHGREGRGGPTEAPDREGLGGRGEGARAHGRRVHGRPRRAVPGARRSRSARGRGVRPRAGRRVRTRPDACGPRHREVRRGDPGRRAASRRGPRQGRRGREAREGGGGRPRARAPARRRRQSG